MHRHRLVSIALVLSLPLLPGCATNDFSDATFRHYRTATYAAAIGDAVSTHVALENCESCRESNPIMEPIVEQGLAATLAVKAASAYFVMRQADMMRKAHNPYWKLFPQVAFVLNGGLLTWNLSLSK